MKNSIYHILFFLLLFFYIIVTFSYILKNLIAFLGFFFFKFLYTVVLNGIQQSTNFGSPSSAKRLSGAHIVFSMEQTEIVFERKILLGYNTYFFLLMLFSIQWGVPTYWNLLPVDKFQRRIIYKGTYKYLKILRYTNIGTYVLFECLLRYKMDFLS